MHRTHGEQPPKGRHGRFFLLVGGFAILLVLNAFITWSMPTFFPTEGSWVSIGPIFGRVCIITNVAAFFVVALLGYLVPEFVGRKLFPVVVFGFVTGFSVAVFCVLTNRPSTVLLALGGGAVGLGSAGALILWEMVFSENTSLGVRRVLLASTASTVVPYYLVATLVQGVSLMLVIALLLVPAVLITLRFALRGGDMPPLPGIDTHAECGGYARAFGFLWVPMLSALAFGLVSPIVDIVALREATSYSINMLLIQVSNVFVAVVLWIIWEKLHADPSITRVCLIILPILAVLLFFFPFATRGYSYAMLFVAAACYIAISILMMVTCIDVAEATKTSLIVIYGIFGGVLYLSRCLGEVIARAFAENPYDQRVQVIASAVFLIYVISLVAFLTYRTVAYGGGGGQVKEASRDSNDSGEIPCEEPYLPSREDLAKAIEARCGIVARTYGLSEREYDVLVLLARGYTIPRIAGELVLSENTVRTHTKRLYSTLGIHTRQELIQLVEETYPV